VLVVLLLTAFAEEEEDDEDVAGATPFVTVGVIPLLTG
jgi:hypothetical protein